MLVASVGRPSDTQAGPSADCVWQEGDAILRRKFPVKALERVDSYEFCIGATRQGLD